MTTQPKDLMTLEEILAEINDRLKTAQRCLEANLRSQAEGKETLELAVRLNGGDVRFHTSALHHLEAGRKLREAAVEAGIGLGAYKASYTPEICESLNAQLCKGHDLIMEALSVAPTAQEVKG